MKQVLFILCLLITLNVSGQKKKNLFKEFFEYSTLYISGDVRNSKENAPSYFVRTNPNGSLYDVPVVVDGTTYYQHDYRYGFGVRKIARFDYEVKGRNYYDGTESTVAMTAPNSAIKGFEYVFHVEKERVRDDVFKNHRYFLRHTGKYHIVKLESRRQGRANFNYNSAEVRAKLPIGKKFTLSAGAIYRTHERPYGYNPVEIWLNETNAQGQAINP